MKKVLEWLRALLDLARGFMLTMWWAGPPLDWDEQVREACGDE